MTAFPEVALTASNLQHLLEGVEDEWERIADVLILPKCEQQAIAENQSLRTNAERLIAVFRYALKMQPYENWRLIIRAFDYLELHHFADKIRHFAEPPREQTLTVENVFKVIELTETDWKSDIGIVLLVLEGMRKKIRNDHSDLKAQKRALSTGSRPSTVLHASKFLTVYTKLAISNLTALLAEADIQLVHHDSDNLGRRLSSHCAYVDS